MRNVVCCFIGSSVLTFSFPAISQSCLKKSGFTSFSFSFQQSALCDCFYNFLHHRNRFYQGKSHKSLSETSETAAWHTDQSCFFHQFHTEFFRCTMSFWHRCPYKHRTFAVRNIPADAAKSAAECLISSLIFFALCKHCVLRTVQSCCRTVLERRKTP